MCLPELKRISALRLPATQTPHAQITFYQREAQIRQDLECTCFDINYVSLPLLRCQTLTSSYVLLTHLRSWIVPLLRQQSCLLNVPPTSVHPMLVNAFLCTFIVGSNGVSFLSLTFTLMLVNSSHDIKPKLHTSSSVIRCWQCLA